MTEMLFDPSWWVPLLIAAVGVAVFVAGNRRQEWQVRKVGAVVVAVAIVYAAVAYLVDTPRETAVKQTRRLVAAFPARDAAGMKAVLDADTIVSDSRNHARFTGRDTIVAAAVAAADFYGLQSVTITSQQADWQQSVIHVDMTLLFTSDRERGGTGQFRAVWEQRQDGWHLTDIQILQIDGQESAPYFERMPLPSSF